MDEKEKMEELHQHKGESDDQECGRQCWAFAQNLKAYSMEGERGRRSADLGK